MHSAEVVSVAQSVDSASNRRIRSRILNVPIPALLIPWVLLRDRREHPAAESFCDQPLNLLSRLSFFLHCCTPLTRSPKV